MIECGGGVPPPWDKRLSSQGSKRRVGVGGTETVTSTQKACTFAAS